MVTETGLVWGHGDRHLREKTSVSKQHSVGQQGA